MIKPIWCTKTCPVCGKKFTFNKQIERRRKYCCDKCRNTVYVEEKNRQRKIRYYKTRVLKPPTCPRCGRKFNAHGDAKYCPDCLEWLAHNEPNGIKRRQYIRNFNVRKDCANRDYIETNRKRKRKVEKTIPKIKVFDREFDTVKEMCESFGIGRGAYETRIRKGYTPEEIIEDKINEGNCSILKAYIRRLKNER